jgi:Uma2 family endonuclease
MTCFFGAVFLVLQDQSRLQPWFVEYLLLLGVVIFSKGRPEASCRRRRKGGGIEVPAQGRHTSFMSLPTHRIRFTFAEYLAFEASSNVKHEYLDGQIYAMAGGTPEHAALAAAVIGLLFPQLRVGPCRALDADLRVRVRATGLATYPDVTVVCGPRELDPDDPNAVTNPTLVVEVLSPSTEDYDRGDKFEHYKRLPSLQQYVIVSHREHRIEVWSRTPRSDWTHAIAHNGDKAELSSIGASLDVRELYAAAAEPSSA